MINKTKSRIIFLVNGLLMAFVISIVLMAFFSLLLRFTSISESKIQLFNYLNILFSLVIAGIYVAMNIKEKGWIHGGVVGFTYFVVIVIMNLIFFKEINSMLLMSRLIISLLSGVIGGMIGINLV